jgi:hypothetical protein
MSPISDILYPSDSAVRGIYSHPSIVNPARDELTRTKSTASNQKTRTSVGSNLGKLQPFNWGKLGPLPNVLQLRDGTVRKRNNHIPAINTASEELRRTKTPTSVGFNPGKLRPFSYGTRSLLSNILEPSDEAVRQTNNYLSTINPMGDGLGLYKTESTASSPRTPTRVDLMTTRSTLS